MTAVSHSRLFSIPLVFFPDLQLSSEAEEGAVAPRGRYASESAPASAGQDGPKHRVEVAKAASVSAWGLLLLLPLLLGCPFTAPWIRPDAPFSSPPLLPQRVAPCHTQRSGRVVGIALTSCRLKYLLEPPERTSFVLRLGLRGEWHDTFPLPVLADVKGGAFLEIRRAKAKPPFCLSCICPACWCVGAEVLAPAPQHGGFRAASCCGHATGERGCGRQLPH